MKCQTCVFVVFSRERQSPFAARQYELCFGMLRCPLCCKLCEPADESLGTHRRVCPNCNNHFLYSVLFISPGITQGEDREPKKP